MMREYTIDCAGIDSPKALHRAFADALSFPGWYGNNYNALHDCLTDIREDTTLILRNFDSMAGFNAVFRLVLEDSEAENPHLFVTIL